MSYFVEDLLYINERSRTTLNKYGQTSYKLEHANCRNEMLIWLLVYLKSYSIIQALYMQSPKNDSVRTNTDNIILCVTNAKKIYCRIAPLNLFLTNIC